MKYDYVKNAEIVFELKLRICSIHLLAILLNFQRCAQLENIIQLLTNEALDMM